MAKANKYAVAIAGIALAAAVVGVQRAGEAQTADKAAIDAGKRLFNTTDPPCTKCHGAEGRGKKDKDMQLDGVSARLSVDEIRAWITDPEAETAKLAKKPKVAMKPQKLTDAEVNNLIAYLTSLKPR